MNASTSSAHALWRASARLCLAVAAWAVAIPAFAGPLGLEMGTPLRQLQSRIRLTVEGPYEYGARSLPAGHPDFRTYRLLVSPTLGLCGITAWTPPMRTGTHGTEIRQRFDRLREALTSRYGAGRRHEGVDRASPWQGPDDWMVALHRKERRHYTTWTDEYFDLEGGVTRVYLSVEALSVSRARLRLGYEFQNTNACIDAIKARQALRL